MKQLSHPVCTRLFLVGCIMQSGGHDSYPPPGALKPPDRLLVTTTYGCLCQHQWRERKNITYKLLKIKILRDFSELYHKSNARPLNLISHSFFFPHFKQASYKYSDIHYIAIVQKAVFSCPASKAWPRNRGVVGSSDYKGSMVKCKTVVFSTSVIHIDV